MEVLTRFCEDPRDLAQTRLSEARLQAEVQRLQAAHSQVSSAACPAGRCTLCTRRCRSGTQQQAPSGALLCFDWLTSRGYLCLQPMPCCVLNYHKGAVQAPTSNGGSPHLDDSKPGTRHALEEQVAHLQTQVKALEQKKLELEVRPACLCSCCALSH